MPDLSNTIDAVMGFVVVILLLSLILQGLQNIIKKVLRMKSRQAEQSLKLLFDYVLTENPSKYAKVLHASPIISNIVCEITDRNKKIEDKSPGDVVVEAIKSELIQLGRKTFWGNALLDSLSKDDVMKIVRTLKAGFLKIDTEAIESNLKEANETEEKIKEEIKKVIDGKVGEIETWYDTVMPGIAQRYERSMKWIAVALSAILVIFMNANAIEIYKYVAADKAIQQRLEQYGKELREKDPATSDEELKSEISAVRDMYSKYRDFGLTPFKYDNVKNWRTTLLGWLVMVILLSVGAPFWEDTLESIFGLKNTLRKKSGRDTT